MTVCVCVSVEIGTWVFEEKIVVYALLHSHLGSLCVCVYAYEDKNEDEEWRGDRGRRWGGEVDLRISDENDIRKKEKKGR